MADDRFALWGPGEFTVIDFAPMDSGGDPLMFDLRKPEAGWRPYNSTFDALKDVRWIKDDKIDEVLSTPVSPGSKDERMKALFRKAAGTSLLIDGVLEKED